MVQQQNRLSGLTTFMAITFILLFGPFCYRLSQWFL